MSDKIQIKKELQSDYFRLSKNVSIMAQEVLRAKNIADKNYEKEVIISDRRTKIVKNIKTVNTVIFEAFREYKLDDVNSDIQLSNDIKEKIIKEISIAIQTLENFYNNIFNEITDDILIYNNVDDIKAELKPDVERLKVEIERLSTFKNNENIILSFSNKFK